MAYLLDTNHCSRILGADSSVMERLSALGKTPLGTSVIVEGELQFMALHSDHPVVNLRRIQDLLKDLVRYPVDGQTAAHYGGLKTSVYRRFGPRYRAKQRHATIGQLGFGDNDLWIAATALRWRLTVVPADSDFRRMAEVVPLSLETW